MHPSNRSMPPRAVIPVLEDSDVHPAVDRPRGSFSFRERLSIGALRVCTVVLLLSGCSRGTREAPESSGGPSPADSAAAVDVLVRFGERLQRVSVLGPDSLVRNAIQAEYGALVSAELLQAWLANPPAAPGRETSSPWPDRIEVVAGTREAEAGALRFVFLGNIVERTSDTPEGGASGRIPVRATVARTAEGWRLTQLTRGRREDALPPPGASRPESRPAMARTGRDGHGPL